MTKIVLRRVVAKDGKSRAFVNDQPVGVALLRRLGALLVEIQGQHAQMELAEVGQPNRSAGRVWRSRPRSGALRPKRGAPGGTRPIA